MNLIPIDYEDLKEFATTSEQQRVLECLRQCAGNTAKAAKASGKSQRTVQRILKGVKSRAVNAGWVPVEQDPAKAVEGFMVTGRSKLLDHRNGGEKMLEWVLERKDASIVHQTILTAIEAMTAEVDGKSTKVKRPTQCDSDLLVTYKFGDPHYGMLAWGKETRASDYDLKIACDIHNAAIAQAVSQAPKAKVCRVLNPGDLLHADDGTNQTRRSRNALDVDGRWQFIVEKCVQSQKFAIETAKRKHEMVHWVSSPGNHDDYSNVAIALILSAYYSNDPRVEVDTHPSRIKYFEFGKCLFGLAHGDAAKVKDLASIMARDESEAWGRTTLKHWDTGHLHNQQRFDFNGVSVEVLPVLIPPDGWHASMGYGARRKMLTSVYHRDGYELAQYSISPMQLQQEAA
jgi:hypothetical protein